jgi:glucose/mannose-6-phosphate isomerase
MDSRVSRYERFIAHEYTDGLLRGHEYSVEDVTDALRHRIDVGVRRVIFAAIGSSAALADVFRGYVLSSGIQLEVHVVSDYDLAALIPRACLSDPATIVVVSSYSGHSNEAILAFERLAEIRDRVLLLTSGGRLAELGRETRTSVALWQLTQLDREYPFLHLPQCFAILLSVFQSLGLIRAVDAIDVFALADIVRRRRALSRELGESLAVEAAEASVLMVAAPLWHDSLLRLCKMHLNEMAMVPASRSYLHEFCHSEVAALSDPEHKQCLLVLGDAADDGYTKQQRRTLLALLSAGARPRCAVRACQISVEGGPYLERLLTTLDVMQHMTLNLARRRCVPSRDLIAAATGDPWYRRATPAQPRERTHTAGPPAAA